MLAKMTPLFALLVLGACGLPEPRICTIERPSTDPKIETLILEPVPCPVAPARAVRESDGGKGFTPPTKPEPNPEPEPDPEPCKGKCGPDPEPDPEPCKGKCNGGDKPGHGHGDKNHDHKGPPGRND